MLDSEGLTKVQSVILIAIIAGAAVVGGVAFVLVNRPQLFAETIRIGICADIDGSKGKGVWQAAILAADQINAEGGVLGRNFTIVAEDDNDESLPVDAAVASNALTKLITVDKADFVIQAGMGPGPVFAYQDICAEHKKINFAVSASIDNFTQRVMDNYDRYKYFFKLWNPNQSSISTAMLEDILTVANYTGFTKIALLALDGPASRSMIRALNSTLSSFEQHNLEVVYIGLYTTSTTDFSSYFADLEAKGAEILVPIIPDKAGIPFVKEWYDRQSPCVVWGSILMAGDSNFWELTEGKCEYISFNGLPVLGGFPLTNKTLPTREAYRDRWGVVPSEAAMVAAYDGVRFILPDAIRRAGTIETEAVIKALEATDVETSMARHFVFTTSHDVFIGAAGPNRPEENYVLTCYFQWQTNATQVLVRPEKLMMEAGGTYKFPPWQGPWSGKS